MTNIYFPVRLNHLLRHCSVGAIVRTDDELLVIKDTRCWVDRKGEPGGDLIHYVEAVKSALDIDADISLQTPPVARQLDNGAIDGVCVPAIRFPTWYVCSEPGCGRLYRFPWQWQKYEGPFYCNEHKHKEAGRNPPKIDQVPWVTIHEFGYLADVDWHYLAHRETRHKCEDRKQLRYYATESGDFVKCDACGSRGPVRERAELPFGRARKQPWIDESAEEPEQQAKIVKINDPGIHYTETRAALVVPPESRAVRGSPLDQLYQSSSLLKSIDQARNDRARKQALAIAARQLRCTPPDIENALVELKNGFPLYGKKVTSGELFEREWEAFHEDIPDLQEGEDFVPVDVTSDWQRLLASVKGAGSQAGLLGAVSRIISVKRLRKIEIMTGFRRSAGDQLVAPDIDGTQDWLPSVELYGEGIFLAFEESVISAWEKQTSLRHYHEVLMARYEAIDLRFSMEPDLSPRFILLHTLAHLLMREMEAIVGYPAASYQERIYSSPNSQAPMAGILIHIAVPDMIGTLGGLSGVAEPDRFLRLMSSAVERGQWCSLDPVCSEQEGQGPGLLNRAACHACAMVPDTSCAYNNVLMDRAVLVGNSRQAFKGFLEFSRDSA